MVPVPGWYPDPWRQADLRWWDGQTWTAAVLVATGGGAARGEDAGARLQRLAAAEVGPARRAAMAMYAGAVSYVLAFLSAALQAHAVFSQFRKSLDAARDGTQPPRPFSYFNPATLALSSLGQLLLMVAGIFFFIWFLASTDAARAAGLPQARANYWAILGFFVPVVSLWFPYQVARDLFPPDDRRRRLAARWWTLYVLQSVAGIGIYVAGWFSEVAALCVAAAMVALVAVLLLAVRSLIAAAAECHCELAARAGGAQFGVTAPHE